MIACQQIESYAFTFIGLCRWCMKELRKVDGEKNPLEIVGKQISSKAKVLCFDEFFVKDITDAMILAGLLKVLFENGTTLVATSNIEPDGLYKDGLQRARFLPAIDLVKNILKFLMWMVE